ncbi:MAG TPA: exonuclease SbcCD subunit D [Clostridiaceae bacterium]|nr:exonuclease SbcCD subunit D [Clostridiaceae bacterium]
MRILHTSDWHLGRTLENINRIDEQKQFIDELCDKADKEDIDLVLVAGDIFDTYNPSAAAEELFFEAINKLNKGGKRAVVVIAGNHDNPERLCASSSLAFRNGIILLGYPSSYPAGEKNDDNSIRVVNSGPGWLELFIEGCEHNAVIITLPYPSEARLDEVLTEELEENKLQRAYSDRVGSIFETLSSHFRDDTVNLVVSHIFVRGGITSKDSERTIQVGGAMTVDPEVLPSKAHYVALGHLHKPQKVKDAPCPAYYSGSPLAYSFSEAGQSKEVFIADIIPGKEPYIKEEYLNCGKPLVKWTARQGIEEALNWCMEGRDLNAWIELEIFLDRPLTMEEQKKLRELNPGIINIKPIIATETSFIEGFEDREAKKIDELFKDYYKYKTGMEISDELMTIFLDVLNSEDQGEDGLTDSVMETTA